MHQPGRFEWAISEDVPMELVAVLFGRDACGVPIGPGGPPRLDASVPDDPDGPGLTDEQWQRLIDRLLAPVPFVRRPTATMSPAGHALTSMLIERYARPAEPLRTATERRLTAQRRSGPGRSPLTRLVLEALGEPPPADFRPLRIAVRVLPVTGGWCRINGVTVDLGLDVRLDPVLLESALEPLTTLIRRRDWPLLD
jgi:hypothetical protein